MTNLARKHAATRSKKTSRGANSKVRATKAVGSISSAIVLVVDDDSSVLRSLNRLLSASGFHVKTFASASELIASDTPRADACMVVDIDMPGMTGIEMCAALKDSGRGLPAILITGRTDARTRTLAEHSDAVAVLFKPFDEEPLLDAIGRALVLSSTNRSNT